LTKGWQILTLIPISAVLASPALGAPTEVPLPAVDSPFVSTQASTYEQLEQKAREAQEKVEWNRHCRPSSEKEYAVAIDGCKKRLGPEQTDERRRCYSEARKEYFRHLSKCQSATRK
jgi:hypothetical protein